MNQLNIIGRLTADTELKQTTSGISVCSFTVAVPRPHSKETTDFIRCVAWRKTAEFIQKYFHKGKMIAVNGILTSRSWKDNDGNSHSVNEVLVENVYFCGDKNKKTEENQEEIPTGFSQIEEEIPF